LSLEVSRLREDIAASGVEMLERDCGLDKRGAEQASDYVRAGRNALGVVPTQDTVVAERFFDEAGGMQLVIHAPFGARINKAWGLALRKRFLPDVQFRTASGGYRQRTGTFAERPAFLPVGTGFQFSENPHGGARADSGTARFADVRRALEMERCARPGCAELLRRSQSSSAYSADARR
jgi:hypothetical protein